MAFFLPNISTNPSPTNQHELAVFDGADIGLHLRKALSRSHMESLETAVL